MLGFVGAKAVGSITYIKIYIFMFFLCSVWTLWELLLAAGSQANDDKNINSIEIKVICYQATEQRQIMFHLSHFFFTFYYYFD